MGAEAGVRSGVAMGVAVGVRSGVAIGIAVGVEACVEPVGLPVGFDEAKDVGCTVVSEDGNAATSVSAGWSKGEIVGVSRTVGVGINRSSGFVGNTVTVSRLSAGCKKRSP